jgi:hypothetical protein
MQQCQVRVFHEFVPSFDPIEWCLKNGLHSGGSNSQPFSHESSALTTRPRLLANGINFSLVSKALVQSVVQSVCRLMVSFGSWNQFV